MEEIKARFSKKEGDLFKDFVNYKDLIEYYVDRRIEKPCDYKSGSKSYKVPCDFPHISTVVQSFTREQFKAYVELGDLIVESYCGEERGISCKARPRDVTLESRGSEIHL